MKIIVEILNKKTDGKDITYVVDDKKTVIISSEKSNTTVNEAKGKLEELKGSLLPDQKIRVLEYHNDEFGDKDRQPCKILYE